MYELYISQRIYIGIGAKKTELMRNELEIEPAIRADTWAEADALATEANRTLAPQLRAREGAFVDRRYCVGVRRVSGEV
jgi:hypothetical protein